MTVALMSISLSFTYYFDVVKIEKTINWTVPVQTVSKLVPEAVWFIDKW
jgi:hypothetical protein